LVRDNPYVHYLTVVRSPWIYIQLLPQVLWTLVPSVVLLGLQWGKRELRKRGLALLFWIAVVVVFHVTLATMGYSKLLRYVILAAPAALVLFAITTAEVVRTLQDGRWVLGSRQASAGLIVLAATGLALQVIQALTTSFVDNRMIDLIRPLPILDLIFG
jgi:4-amino-4-deoxy-L-arabinose transferase-like glycosyltransferase